MVRNHLGPRRGKNHGSMIGFAVLGRESVHGRHEQHVAAKSKYRRSPEPGRGIRQGLQLDVGNRRHNQARTVEQEGRLQSAAPTNASDTFARQQ